MTMTILIVRRKFYGYFFECNDRLSRKRDALNMMNIVEVMEEREKVIKRSQLH